MPSFVFLDERHVAVVGARPGTQPALADVDAEVRATVAAVADWLLGARRTAGAYLLTNLGREDFLCVFKGGSLRSPRRPLRAAASGRPRGRPTCSRSRRPQNQSPPACAHR